MTTCGTAMTVQQIRQILKRGRFLHWRVWQVTINKPLWFMMSFSSVLNCSLRFLNISKQTRATIAKALHHANNIPRKSSWNEHYSLSSVRISKLENKGTDSSQNSNSNYPLRNSTQSWSWAAVKWVMDVPFWKDVGSKLSNAALAVTMVLSSSNEAFFREMLSRWQHCTIARFATVASACKQTRLEACISTPVLSWHLVTGTNWKADYLPLLWWMFCPP